MDYLIRNTTPRIRSGADKILECTIRCSIVCNLIPVVKRPLRLFPNLMPFESSLRVNAIHDGALSDSGNKHFAVRQWLTEVGVYEYVRCVEPLLPK